MPRVQWKVVIDALTALQTVAHKETGDLIHCRRWPQEVMLVKERGGVALALLSMLQRNDTLEVWESLDCRAEVSTLCVAKSRFFPTGIEGTSEGNMENFPRSLQC